METHLQSRSCWRKAQCGPVKPASGITASLRSACYNLPAACPAPAPHSRATQPVFLQAHTSTPTHHGHCSSWLNREVSEEQSLSMFPHFLSCMLKLDGLEKIAQLSLELKRLGNKALKTITMRLRRIKISENVSPKKKTLNKACSQHVAMMSSRQPLRELN